GHVADFDADRIKNAITKAFRATGKSVNDDLVEQIVSNVVLEVNERFVDLYPNVENIQDIVEKYLMRNELFDVAKHYILYRAQRQKVRDEEKKKTIEKTLLGKLKVKKRNGET